jgi:hypothetical protein
VKRSRRKGKSTPGSSPRQGRAKNIAAAAPALPPAAHPRSATPPQAAAQAFTVTGTLRGQDGKPRRQARGRVFDKDMRSEELLGEFVTDHLGQYFVGYAPKQFGRAEKASADLVVRIYAPSGRELAASPIRFNAGPAETIDITVDDASPGLSEFERIVGELTGIAQGVPIAKLVDDNKHQDISFAAGELGIERRLIELVVLAHRLAANTKVSPATFYGLFRRDLPTDLAALALRGVPAWRVALKEALAANLIPATSAKRLDQEIAALRALTLRQALAADKPGRPTLGQFLAANPRISSDDRKKLITVVMELGEDAVDWDKLAAAHGITEKTIAEVGYATRLFTLLGDNAKLVKDTVAKRKSEDPKAALRELAALSASDWEQRLAGIVNDDELKTRAAEIAQRIERDMSTAVVAHRMSADTEHGEPDVAAFLHANPEFDLLSTSVDAFLKGCARNDAAGLGSKLKRWQRLARLGPETERYPAMRGLKALGVTSAIKAAWRNELALRSTSIHAPDASSGAGARQATRLGAVGDGNGARASPGDTFVSPPGSGVADSVHGVAEWVSSAGVTLHEHFITPPGILTLIGGSGFGKIPVEAGAPDWRSLFGSLNGCKCRHCGSVHGPAAYFVDLLRYLDFDVRFGSGASAVSVRPLATLVARRPDLRHIELSCDNSETPLPYIDLVNEILELAVERADGSGPFWEPSPPDADYREQIKWWQTRIDSPEAKLLRMEPQHESPGAYERLAGERFPWVLPFDLGDAKLAVYLDHLGVRAEEIFEIFSLGDAADRARLRLGFAPAEWHIVRGEDAADPLVFWGVPTLEALAPVPAFLAHADLSFEQLEELTRLSYPPGKIDIQRPGDPCNIDTFVVTNLSGPLLAELMRFLRLRRRLGWSIPDLDACLVALRITTIDMTALVKIAALVRLIERYDLSLATALRLFALPSDAPPPPDARVLARIMGVHPMEAARYLELAEAPAMLDPEALTGILDGWEAIKPLGLSIGECRYILRHQDQLPAAFEPSDDELDAALDELREAVPSAPEAPAGATESEADRRSRIKPVVLEALARQLAIPLADLLRLVDDVEVDGTLKLAVLRTGRRDPRDIGVPVIEDFLDAVAVASPDHEVTQQAKNMIVRLRKTARLVLLFGLNAHRLDAIEATRDDNGFLDFNRLPFASTAAGGPLSGLVALASAMRINSELTDGDQDLFQVMLYAATVTDRSSFDFAEVTAVTGWDATETGGWLASQTDADPRILFRKAVSYERAGRTIRRARELRTRPDVLAGWVRGPASAVREHLQAVTYAGDVKALADALTPHMDNLRNRKRDALLGYLLTRGTSPLTGKAYKTPKDVYDAFLIDPEMSACMMTARIKQATASVQLFVQRLLLGIEPGMAAVPALPEPVAAADQRNIDMLESHWRQWDWMRNYRVWEAATKVLVAPENFLEPDLLDNKSPLFRAAEDELLQGELNDDNIEQVFQHYVEGLREIAHLDVRGMYEERTAGEEKGVLHVFARTPSVPYVYYYRRRLATDEWTPWERVGADIESDHLIPIAHNGRVMIFWPVFREMAPPTSSSPESPPEDKTKYASRFGLAWSSYRGGSWENTRQSETKWRLSSWFSQRELRFRAVQQDGGLVDIEVYNERLGFPIIMQTIHVDINDMKFSETRLTPPEDSVAWLVRWIEEHRPIPNTSWEFVSATENTRHALDHPFRYPTDSTVIVWSTPGVFRVRLPISEIVFRTGNPFVFSLSMNDEVSILGERTFINQSRMYLAAIVRRERRYQFDILYHPYVGDLNSAVNVGVAELLNPAPGDTRFLKRQRKWEGFETRPDGTIYNTIWKFDELRPDRNAVVLDKGKVPVEEYDFTLRGAYANYNWELFFHLPFLVAIRLSQDGQFDKARRWFHYIFDPTDSSSTPWPAKFWQTRPFYSKARDGIETAEDLIRQIGSTDPGAVESWRTDPFNPHKIARVRIVAYMKAVVFKYLDNLIAWADDLFRRDTLETLNEATLLYVLAAELLGEKPTLVEPPERASDTPDTYARLELRFDELGTIWEDLETHVAPAAGTGSPSGGRSARPAPVFLPLFCLPSNDRLLEYWDTIADRLFKIRHCRDIEGRVRQLPLYEPPIDPALLVRARAAGIDLRDALRSEAAERPPRHRYRVLHQRALELAGDVRDLANSLLSALEKADGEALAELRARHDRDLQEDLLAIRNQQIDELAASIEGLQKSRELVQARRAHYASLAHINAQERLHLDKMAAAADLQNAAAILNLLSRELSLIPDFTAGVPPETTFGGSQLGTAAGMYAQAFDWNAALLTYQANRAAILGGFDRRQEDWDLQVELADKEIAQLDKQIVGAEIRLAIAENEKRNQERQIARTREAYDFLRQKFTDKELYRWLAGQLSALHYQAYAMAYEAARRAETAANFELGLSEPERFDHIRVDNWEPGRKGLLAAERLRQQLRRLDDAFLENDRRTFELTKHVSLAQIDPLALITLKSTGRCTFDVPEVVFDLDHPGHYLRRIKAVSLTVPCVVGPYASVSARLTLDQSWIRPRATRSEAPSLDLWLPVVTTIATSSAQRDAGVFELNFRDEQLLPFEGAGVISRWTLELPGRPVELPGRPVRQFDYQTISDVIVHVQYKARESAEPSIRSDVASHLVAALNDFRMPDGAPSSDERPGLKRAFSMAHEFGTEWFRFLHPAAGTSGNALTIQLSKQLFQHVFHALTITINGVEIYFVDGQGSLTPDPASGPVATDIVVTDSEQPFVLDRERFSPPPGDTRDCIVMLYFTVA